MNRVDVKPGGGFSRILIREWFVMRRAGSTRRTFLMNSAVAGLTARVGLETVAHAGGNETLRVGLVGCGGRGTGAADQALSADPGAKLVAMCDVFGDILEESHNTLKGLKVAERVDVPPERRFVGFDGFKQVIDQVDVVLLATPPHFRPEHLAYAVEKGVHAFVEKPIATDAPGVRSVLETCEKAKEKRLSIVSGLCWRYRPSRRETMQRVLDGAIGPVVAIETTYNSGGVWEPRRTREQCANEMEYQMRNWYYYCWLSGDHIVEQAVHALDTMGWAMGDQPPEKCFGVGGRQVRVEPQYGDIYDHFSIVYEYSDGARGYHQCRHWRNTYQRTKDFILGSKGRCDVFGTRISGETNWRYRGPDEDMYQAEHDALFASIRKGEPIEKDGLYMARSTMLAIMGRMAAYTGEEVTWEKALNSTERLGPSRYEWGDIPRREVPRPGVTRLS
jgi:predicted dehydrogenase